MKRNILIALFAVLLAALGGCRVPEDHYESYSPVFDKAKLEQIKPFEAEKFEKQPLPADSAKPAPASLDLPIDQFRVYVLENNLDIKTELISPDIAAQSVRQERAKFEPSLYSNMRLSKSDQPQAAPLALEGTQVESGFVNLGVEMPLTTGGKISFDLADVRTKTDYGSAFFDPSYTTDATVSISQPLLRDAGSLASTHSIRIARFNEKITESQAKLEIIKVLGTAEKAYWNLYAARRQLEVRRKEHELARELLEQAGRFVKAGQRTQIEVIRAEAGVAQRLEAIILAENEVRRSQRELKRFINIPGIEPAGLTELKIASNPMPVHLEFDNAALILEAFENRMELLELEFRLASDQSTIDYLRNQALPIALLDYRYNINGLAETRGGSYDVLYDRNFEDHQLGLRVVIPIGNEAAKSRLRSSILQKRQRLSSVAVRKQLIEVEVLNAIDQIQANWQRLLAARQNTILQAELLDAQKRQFEQGMGTATDVLETQTSFADAQSNEIRALADYQQTMVDLAYATGTLLGTSSISWKVPGIEQ